MFNVRVSERPGRTEEALDIIKRLWAGETVTHQGRYYRTTGAFLSPLPLQKPRPPIWIGAHAEEAIRRAARISDGWVASYNASVDELAHKIAVFREAVKEHGTKGEIVLMRDGFVAESYAEARRIFEKPILDLYRGYADWKRDSPDAYKYANLTFEAFEHRLVFGDPDAVRHAVAMYAEMGVETLILRFQPPGLDHEATMRCLRLFAEEIIAPLRVTTP
jgi:alkanesulfonate monooxygenase SsuD/methylene tetrahydromethanopterin reductase-like flavin-dependent oxidoreductase (luciferase family)